MRLVGERVGRFSLFRDVEGERAFTDLRLIPTTLVPALVAALSRVAAAPPEVPRGPTPDAPARRDRIGQGVA